ncbi:MAG: hypothetical protein SFU86_02715 [Pirellulaceae bacterium]|nr:hypothetical protein [Pirellulaceae bacterium]
MPIGPRLAVAAWAVCAAVAAASAGCWQVPSGVVPVSGVVLLDGQPLPGAVVTLQPLREGSTVADEVGGSVGRTDAEGRFVLRLVRPDSPGAAVGKHVVTITTAHARPTDAVAPQGERVPAPWRNGTRTVEIPAGGTDALRLEIQSRN